MPTDRESSTPLFTVDAFTSSPFTGNPAAICFPSGAPDERTDDWLAAVAREMNLSETAFLWSVGDAWRLRWLTPAAEVELCGHATLAAAHVLFTTGRASGVARFDTLSGRLTATQTDGLIELDFPATVPEAAEPPAGLFEALGCRGEVMRSRFDALVLVATEADVRAVSPDFRALREVDARGVIVSAPGDDCDFVSRFFAPRVGVDEDPVTGSAHCALTPYWAARLDKTRLSARQLSRRGGSLEVEHRGARVLLRGNATTVMRGELLA